jgi:hypothetical protein
MLITSKGWSAQARLEREKSGALVLCQPLSNGENPSISLWPNLPIHCHAFYLILHTNATAATFSSP